MPYGNGTPTPDEHATKARDRLAEADRYDPDVAIVTALQGVGEALLAVAGQLEVIREHGIYRPEDGR